MDTNLHINIYSITLYNNKVYAGAIGNTAAVIYRQCRMLYTTRKLTLQVRVHRKGYAIPSIVKATTRVDEAPHPSFGRISQVNVDCYFLDNGQTEKAKTTNGMRLFISEAYRRSTFSAPPFFMCVCLRRSSGVK